MHTVYLCSSYSATIAIRRSFYEVKCGKDLYVSAYKFIRKESLTKVFEK